MSKAVLNEEPELKEVESVPAGGIRPGVAERLKGARPVSKPSLKAAQRPAGERLDKFLLSEEGRRLSSSEFWQGLSEDSGASFEEVDDRNPMWFGSALKVVELGDYAKAVEELSLSVCKRLELDAGYGFLGVLKNPEIHFNGWMSFWLHLCRSVFLCSDGSVSSRGWTKEWGAFVAAATVPLASDKGWGSGLKIGPFESIYFRCVVQSGDKFEVAEDGRALLGSAVMIYGQLLHGWQSETAWSALSPEGGRSWRWSRDVSDKGKVNFRKLFDRCGEIAGLNLLPAELASTYENGLFEFK